MLPLGHSEGAAAVHIYPAARTSITARTAGEDAAGGAVAQGKTCAATHGNMLPLQIQLLAVEAEDHLTADGDGLGASVLYIAGQVVAAAG